MKIEVVNTRYPDGVPNGTIMTVTHKYDSGACDATVDSGNGYEWFVPDDMYRAIPDVKREVSDIPTTGTLAKLNVKQGDVVENKYSLGEYFEIRNKNGMDALWSSDYGYWGVYVEDSTQNYTIISRASDEPTFDPLDPPAFGELTDAQKVDILEHSIRGGEVEFWSIFEGCWEKSFPTFKKHMRYRKKPQPVRETVTVYGAMLACKTWLWGAKDPSDTHRITFDTIDGKPVCDSIKMEDLG